MNRATRTLAILLPLTALTACGLFSSNSVGLSKVEDLVTWIERVHVDSELSKERVRIAVRTLHTLVAPNFSGDLVTAYSDFVRAIELSEAQAKELHTSQAAMQEAAEPVFEQWEQDLGKFSGEGMRQRSGVRLAATRQRYETIVDATEPAIAAHDRFNLSMRDHALFLGHDFNAAAIAEIDADIRAVTKLGGELESQFDLCLEAARNYVESAALPLDVDKVADEKPRDTLRSLPLNDGKNLEAQRRQRAGRSNKL